MLSVFTFANKRSLPMTGTVMMVWRGVCLYMLPSLPLYAATSYIIAYRCKVKKE